MRFVLDEDVDARSVGSLLRNRGHDCWTVVEAGPGGADDDAVATYADNQGAALITHDAEATRRRLSFTSVVMCFCVATNSKALSSSTTISTS